MGVIALVAVTIVLVLWGEPARASLNELLGIEAREIAGREATLKALALRPRVWSSGASCPASWRH
jgi:hypothetical protein